MSEEAIHIKTNRDEYSEGRIRIGRISKNFFLHIHAPRVHPFSLKPWYTFGLGMILGFLFLIMIFTGVVLMLNYTPSVENAYNSVKDIVQVVPGGKFIRNIHRLAANSMVMLVFLHLLRVFFTGSYLEGRKLNWIIGVSMFLVVLMMNFSGYLLPWDQLSYWAVTIGSNIAASARELTDMVGLTAVFDPGGFLQRILIGGDTVGQPALTRFFMMHVVFLPLTLLVLTAVHFWRIRKDGGLSRPNSNEIRSQEKYYSWPVLLWAELAIFLAVLAILMILAFFIDAPLLGEANPSHPENPAKSPWYFLGIQELVSYSAFTGGLVVPVMYIAFLVSIPYIDHEDQYIGHWFSGKKGLRLAAWSLLVSVITVLLFVGIKVSFGWLRDWIPGIPQVVTMLFNPASLPVIVFIIYASAIRKRTGSTRMAAIGLFTVSAGALILFTVIGIWFRGENWQFVL